MPRSRTDDWRTRPPPATPLERGAFLDACTAWLVAEPVEVTSDAIDTRTTSTVNLPRTEHLGMVARTHSEFQAHVAGHPECSGAGVVACPFAQRCVVCSRCLCA